MPLCNALIFFACFFSELLGSLFWCLTFICRNCGLKCFFCSFLSLLSENTYLNIFYNFYSCLAVMNICSFLSFWFLGSFYWYIFKLRDFFSLAIFSVLISPSKVFFIFVTVFFLSLAFLFIFSLRFWFLLVLPTWYSLKAFSFK
jgi:hypothetical protein